MIQSWFECKVTYERAGEKGTEKAEEERLAAEAAAAGKGHQLYFGKCVQDRT